MPPLLRAVQEGPDVFSGNRQLPWVKIPTCAAKTPILRLRRDLPIQDRCPAACFPSESSILYTCSAENIKMRHLLLLRRPATPSRESPFPDNSKFRRQLRTQSLKESSSKYKKARFQIFRAPPSRQSRSSRDSRYPRFKSQSPI